MRYSLSFSPLPRKVCSETNSRNLLFLGELAKCLLSRIRRNSSRFSKREIGRATGLCNVVTAAADRKKCVCGACPGPIFTARTIALHTSTRQRDQRAKLRPANNGYQQR